MKNRFFLGLLILAAITIGVVSCYKHEDYDVANREANTSFAISVDKDSIAADGTSQMLVTITGLPEKLADADNKIVVETGIGQFVPSGTNKTELTSTLVLSGNNYVRTADVRIRAGLRTGSGQVKATIKGVTQTKNISFFQALPDRIKVLPGAIFIQPSFTTGQPIEVVLSRNSGSPTLGTEVQVDAVNSSGAPVGSFQRYQNLSDSSGKTYFTYFFTDPNYQGTLRIRARYTHPQRTLADSSTITVY